MKKNKKNEGGLWTAKFSEVVASLQVLEKNGFTREMLDCLRGANGNVMAKEIVSLFLNRTNDPDVYKKLIKEWEVFYEKYFHISFNLSTVKIPTPVRGFNRLIIIPQGITTQTACIKSKEHFSVLVHQNIDGEIVSNERWALERPYAIWVKDVAEPERNYRDQSYRWIKETGVLSETLLERLIHGLKYWDENKKQLDVEAITLCAGTTLLNNSAVTVSCISNGQVSIEYGALNNHHRIVGAREVISWDI